MSVLHSLRKKYATVSVLALRQVNRRVSKGLANWLCERMQLGFRGLAPSFCL